MLYYDRIDISEGIDPAKNNNSKECLVCHYWFFSHEFEFQILFVMLLMLCRRCLLILATLLFLLLKMLIIVVSFMTLANLTLFS